MEINVDKLKVEMMNSCLNVKTLSEKSGVSQPAINLILHHGRRARLDTIGKLAAALGVSGMELIKA